MSSTGPKYPVIEVELSSLDSNVYAILWHTQKALRRAHVPQAEIDAFKAEATSGDYDHAIQTVMKWVKTS